MNEKNILWILRARSKHLREKDGTFEYINVGFPHPQRIETGLGGPKKNCSATCGDFVGRYCRPVGLAESLESCPKHISSGRSQVFRVCLKFRCTKFQWLIITTNLAICKLHSIFRHTDYHSWMLANHEVILMVHYNLAGLHLL